VLWNCCCTICHTWRSKRSRWRWIIRWSMRCLIAIWRGWRHSVARHGRCPIGCWSSVSIRIGSSPHLADRHMSRRCTSRARWRSAASSERCLSTDSVRKVLRFVQVPDFERVTQFRNTNGCGIEQIICFRRYAYGPCLNS